MELIPKFLTISFAIFLSFFTEYATPWIFIALLPLLIVSKAFRMADEWIIKWNDPEADRQKVPYELLLVNVSTIAIHFLTGLLISIAYLI